MGDPLHRGTTEHADCQSCPLSTNGLPTHPVVSEYPDDPSWFVVGEGPGFHETRQGRPFIGATGQCVNKILHKIGRPREQLYITNATLCQPPQGASVELREHAAACCKPRLDAELAAYPGKPVLTLGAVAAKSVIPKPILDAIDPPDVPKTRKKIQKERQKNERKAQHKAEKRIEREKARNEKGIGVIARKRFATIMKLKTDELYRTIIRRHGRKPDRRFVANELEPIRKPVWEKCWKDAQKIWAQKLEEKRLQKLENPKPPKPKKKKPVKITDIVGTLFDIDVDGTGSRPVVPAIHPAALLRGGGASIGGSHTPDMAFVNIIYDAAKCDSLARGKDIRLYIDFDFEVFDAERANALLIGILQEIIDTGSGSLDLETYVEDTDRHHALMAWTAKIRVIGLATKHRAVSVGWDLISPIAKSYLQLVLGTKMVNYHHGLYDRTVLRNQHHGLILPIKGIDSDEHMFEDSLYAHHAAFPGNSHKLQTVTAQFYGVQPWKSEFRNTEETPESLAIYNAKDTFCTEADVAALTVWIKRTDTERVYDIDRKMVDIASSMHLNGMPVDREINSTLLTSFTRLARDARKAVEEVAANKEQQDLVKHYLAIMLAQKQRKKEPNEFEERYQIRLADLGRDDWYWNVNNSKHVAALLQALGIPLTAETAGGAVSTKKDVLESIVQYPIVRGLLTYRENEKMRDFVWPIFDREYDGQLIQPGFADEDDRIHPIWSIHKISGRWAGSEPFGVSNPPREKPSKPVERHEIPRDAIIIEQTKDGKWVYASRPTTKRQVRARKGRKLVGFDFAQVEARILALLSGDDFMCSVFENNGDLHIECALEVFPGFKDRPEKERKMMRTVCKTLEYATWYGADDETVWKGLLKEGYNFKLVDVMHSLAVLRKKMSGIVRWQRETIHAASSPPFTLKGMILGRRRVWPMGQVDQGEALNIVPQTTAAEVMDLGMYKMACRIYDRGYRQCFPIVQVHDACVFECWAEDAEAVLKDIEDCFTYEHSNPKNGRTVRFPVDAAIGDSWNEV